MKKIFLTVQTILCVCYLAAFPARAMIYYPDRTANNGYEGGKERNSVIYIPDRSADDSMRDKTKVVYIPKREAEIKSESENDTHTKEQADAEALAQLCWGEARGVRSKAQKAAVMWCVLNRCDAQRKSITQVIMAKNQFAGYSAENPVEGELLNLAFDVLDRWKLEKEGTANVGRVLPKDYLYFSGDGVQNYFRDRYSGDYHIWDWSLPSPYAE